MPDPYGYDPYRALYDTSWLSRYPTAGRGGGGSAGFSTPPSFLSKPKPQKKPSVFEQGLQGLVGGAGAVGDVLHTGLWAAGLQKQGVDWLGRKASAAMGTPVPEDWTIGKMAMEATFPVSKKGSRGLYDTDATHAPSYLAASMTPIEFATRAAEVLARKGGVDEELIQKAKGYTDLFSMSEYLRNSPKLRAAVSTVGEAAIDFGTDPLMYELGLPSKLLLPGAQKAASVASKVPGVSQYAPEIAEALASAIKSPVAATLTKGGRMAGSPGGKILRNLGASNEAISTAAKYSGKAVHGAFLGSMGTGAIQGLGGAGLEYLQTGEVTPEMVAAMTHGGLSAGMAGLMVGGHFKQKAAQARSLADLQSKDMRPALGTADGPLPLDLIPDKYSEWAEAWADELSQEFVRGVRRDGAPIGPGAVRTNPVTTAMEMLPEELQPYLKPIIAQARAQATALREGSSFIKDVQAQSPEGVEGIAVEPARDRQTGELNSDASWLVMRDAEGKVTGAAQYTENAAGVKTLEYIAGGKAHPDGPKEGMSRLFEKLDDMGIERTGELSILGVRARRHKAEKRFPRPVLKGQVSPKEFRDIHRAAVEEREEQSLREQRGLDDILASAVYATDPASGLQAESGKGTIFFSQLRKEMTAPTVQETQRGEHWLGMLGKSKREITKQEMKWSGLGEFLRGKKRERVTRKEIIDFLDENVVEVEEVLKGPGETPWEAASATPELLAKRKAIFDEYTEPLERVGEVISAGIEGRIPSGGYVVTPEGPSRFRDARWFLEEAEAEQYAAEHGGQRVSASTTAEARNARNRLEVEREQRADREAGSIPDPDPHRELQRIERSQKIANDEWQTADSELTKALGKEGFSDKEILDAHQRDDAAEFFEAHVPEAGKRWNDANADLVRLQVLEQRAREASNYQDTEHSSEAYQMPGGGKNYRELLITKPGRGAASLEQPFPVHSNMTRDAANTMALRLQQDSLAGRIGEYPQGTRFVVVPSAEGGWGEGFTVLRRKPRAAEDEFTGSHYSEKNIVAHVRMNDRVGPNGEKVLFVEEVQSDWAQQGREKGFKTGKDNSARIEEINSELIDLQQKLVSRDRTFFQWLQQTGQLHFMEDAQGHLINEVNFLHTELGQTLWSKFSEQRDVFDSHSAMTDRKIALEGEKRQLSRPGIARGPFVERTQDWTKLTMRRVLKFAADNGYDQVAWTKGKHQVDRWEGALRQQVDRIEWKKTKDGIHLRGLKASGDRPSGHDVEVVNTTQEETTLSDAIGKVMADRIINDKNQSGVIADEWIVTRGNGSEVGRFKDSLSARKARTQDAYDSDPDIPRLRDKYKKQFAKVPYIKLDVRELKEKRAALEMQRRRLLGRRTRLEEENKYEESDALKEKYEALKNKVDALTRSIGEQSRATAKEKGVPDENSKEYKAATRTAEKLATLSNKVTHELEFGKDNYKIERTSEGGIKIDDAGMAASYDRIIPDIVNRIVSQFQPPGPRRRGVAGSGGLAQQGKLGKPSAVKDQVFDVSGETDGADYASGKWSGWGRDEVPRTFETQVEAKAFAEKNGGDYGPQAAFTAHAVDITPEMRSPESRIRRPPLFAAEGKTGPVAPEAIEKLLLKIYPKGTHIKVVGEGSERIYAVTLPNKTMVTWQPGVDHITINSADFKEGYGRPATETELKRGAVGATYRLPNRAIIEIATRADARIPIHEHWHVIKHLGSLTKKQLANLSKRFGGNEELEADAFADWAEAGMKEPITTFQRIARGVRNLYDIVKQNPESVFRQAAEGLGQPKARVRKPVEAHRERGKAWKKMWGKEGPLGKQRLVQGEPRAVGAPPRITAQADFEMLKDSTKGMAYEGRLSRPWYRRSSQAILDAVGGNKDDAQTIAQLVAIYSPQTAVQPNMDAAIRAWNQYKSGAKEITAGRTQSSNRTAEDLLFRGQSWDGRKTNNFYGNLMLQIDPKNAENANLVTVDIHMMRALGYEQAAPSLQQYRWAEKFFKDIAYDLEWEPHEVQAAVWTSQKYRREVLEPFAKKQAEGKLQGQEPPAIKNFDFADALAKSAAHVNMEAVPHPTTGVLPELAGAPIEVRRDYTEGFRREVLHDEYGRDRVAAVLGIPVEGGFLAPGYYEGRLEPGFKASLPAPRELGGAYASFREMGQSEWTMSKDMGPKSKAPPEAKALEGTGRYLLDREERVVYTDRKASESDRQQMLVDALGEITGDPVKARETFDRTRGIDPGTEAQIRRYAAVQGYLMRQEMVGYGRSVRVPKGQANAWAIDMGRGLTEVEVETLMNAMARELGTTAGDARMKGIFPKTTPEGVVLVNFTGFESSPLDNTTFLDAARKAQTSLGVDNIVNYGYAKEHGNAISNDWSQFPKGEKYAEAFADEGAPGGPPDLPAWVAGVRAEADAYNARFAAGQGWGQRAGGATGPGLERTSVRSVETDPAQPRGPPGAGRSKYATEPGAASEASGIPEGGSPKPAGEKPRVEQRVETLDEALAEQRALGIPGKALNLSREHRRAWKSLDPAIRKQIIEWDDESILTRAVRGRLDDVQVMALDAVVRGRREAKEATRLEFLEAKGTGAEDAAWTKYAQSLADFVALERANVNDGSGTGRALRARGRIMQAGMTADRQFLKQVFREFEGVSEADANQMLQMFESGDPLLADAIRATMAGRWKQWQTLLRSFLITPSSEAANVFGNTLVQGIELVDSSHAAGLDWAVSMLRGTQRERFLGEAGAEVGGMLEATPEALNTFLNERFVQIYKRAWTGELAKDAQGNVKLELGRRLEYQVSPFKGKLGRMFATSLDALQAGDELFAAPIRQGLMAKHAYRMAVKKLGKGAGVPALQADMVETIRDLHRRPEMYPDLLNTIRSQTARRLFRDKPWAAVDMIRQIDTRWPWVTAVLPFVRTPSNIARYAIHHSPLGFLTPDVVKAIQVLKGKKKNGKLGIEWTDKFGEQRTMDQGQAVDIVSQRLVGTAVFATAMAAAHMGKLTGGGPPDWNEKKAKMETGWRPYSIVATDPTTGKKLYIPFSRFDPIAQMLGVAADVVELPNVRDPKDIVSKAIGSIGENFTNRTYLKGLIDWSEALSDPANAGARYLISIGTMHVPRMSGRLATALDPVMRDVRPTTRGLGGFPERLGKSIARDIPVLSKQVPARYGPTGEPIVRPGTGVLGGVMRALSPVQISGERTGRELEGLMAEIGYVPGEPRNFMTIRGQQIMLDREHIDLLHLADRNAANELRRLMRNPRWELLPDSLEEGGANSKVGQIRKAYDKYRDMAKQMILRSYTFQRTAREQLSENARAR